jgi:hypothetical protein
VGGRGEGGGGGGGGGRRRTVVEADTGYGAVESALDAAAAAQLLPRLTDAEATEAVLQRHPLVRGASGLVCTGTAENRQAWCSMLRDLFSASGHRQDNVAAAAGFAKQDNSDGTVNSICASTKDQCLESQRLLDYQQGNKGFVSDAAILRVYLVCRQCCRSELAHH